MSAYLYFVLFFASQNISEDGSISEATQEIWTAWVDIFSDTNKNSLDMSVLLGDTQTSLLLIQVNINRFIDIFIYI